jgi:hypothetical protein
VQLLGAVETEAPTEVRVAIAGNEVVIRGAADSRQSERGESYRADGLHGTTVPLERDPALAEAEPPAINAQPSTTGASYTAGTPLGIGTGRGYAWAGRSRLS